jgi:hypothetical protein
LNASLDLSTALAEFHRSSSADDAARSKDAQIASLRAELYERKQEVAAQAEQLRTRARPATAQHFATVATAAASSSSSSSALPTAQRFAIDPHTDALSVDQQYGFSFRPTAASSVSARTAPVTSAPTQRHLPTGAAAAPPPSASVSASAADRISQLMAENRLLGRLLEDCGAARDSAQRERDEWTRKARDAERRAFRNRQELEEASAGAGRIR